LKTVNLLHDIFLATPCPNKNAHRSNQFAILDIGAEEKNSSHEILIHTRSFLMRYYLAKGLCEREETVLITRTPGVKIKA